MSIAKQDHQPVSRTFYNDLITKKNDLRQENDYLRREINDVANINNLVKAKCKLNIEFANYLSAKNIELIAENEFNQTEMNRLKTECDKILKEYNVLKRRSAPIRQAKAVAIKKMKK